MIILKWILKIILKWILRSVGDSDKIDTSQVIDYQHAVVNTAMNFLAPIEELKFLFR
jgi:hypothetical protein